MWGHWLIAGILGLAPMLGMLGCEEAVVEELVQESEVIGTWNYVPQNARDPLSMTVAFHRTGKYEQRRGQELLTGRWRVDESDLLIDQTWTKLPQGEELDLTVAGIILKYRIRMRGKELLIEPEGSSEPWVFLKAARHTSLFEPEEPKGDGKAEEKKGH